ncbi:hypothetical protein PQU92_10985 [Asticcacaulis sp. BYS171W]|uniref:TonB C-terminal domain-containing protein n=1 Tax=Asticcacaulis aquaticus TaxID=2984212 RepID=A0ABT5HUT5_9CAUL|nr:hypothetical protein [Asticcacaulis aquaticus]MDC7683804.1 hypothetical protein [Asticcacaulis aquaticus]
MLLAWLAAALPVSPDIVKTEDLILIEQLSPPDLLEGQTMHIDLEASGKRFVVICTINAEGYLTDCHNLNEDYPDKAYVRNVLKYLQTWRYDTQSKFGESVVGKKAQFGFSYTLE